MKTLTSVEIANEGKVLLDMMSSTTSETISWPLTSLTSLSHLPLSLTDSCNPSVECQNKVGALPSSEIKYGNDSNMDLTHWRDSIFSTIAEPSKGDRIELHIGSDTRCPQCMLERGGGRLSVCLHLATVTNIVRAVSFSACECRNEIVFLDNKSLVCNGPLHMNRKFCVKLRAYTRYGYNDSLCSNILTLGRELRL